MKIEYHSHPVRHIAVDEEAWHRIKGVFDAGEMPSWLRTPDFLGLPVYKVCRPEWTCVIGDLEADREADERYRRESMRRYQELLDKVLPKGDDSIMSMLRQRPTEEQLEEMRVADDGRDRSVYEQQMTAYLNTGSPMFTPEMVREFMRREEEERDHPRAFVYHPEVFAAMQERSTETPDFLTGQGLQMDLTDAGRRWVRDILGLKAERHEDQDPAERGRKMNAAEAKRARRRERNLKR